MIQKEYIYYIIFFEMLGIANIIAFKNIESLYFYVLLHIGASFLTALVLYPFFATKFKKQKIKIVFVLSNFIFFTSILGIIASFLYITSTKLYSGKKNSLQVNIIETEKVVENIPVIKRKFGEGALQNFSSNTPSAIKLNLLSIQKKIKFKNKGKILKEALSDNDDEIRLLAFSILSKEEDSINKKIFELKETLKDASKTEHAYIYKNIGILYWESIFLEIADEELKNYYLKLSKENFLESLKLKSDHEVKFYLGRIALLEKNIDYAEKMFIKAYKLGDKRVIPYLMEIKYNKKDFKSIIELSKKIDFYTIHPNFYFNYRVWSDEKV